jgi:hypothetical protein
MKPTLTLLAALLLASLAALAQDNKKPEENWATGADPGFVDAAKGDFRLRPDAAVFKKLPGFKPIPFKKIGLFTDTLRPKREIEPWAYPPPKPALPPEKRADSPR